MQGKREQLFVDGCNKGILVENIGTYDCNAFWSMGEHLSLPYNIKTRHKTVELLWFVYILAHVNKK